MTDWKPIDAEKLYHLRGWGQGYFSVNAAGHIAVHPAADQGPAVDLYQLVQQVQGEGLRLPLLLRFQDILRHRVAQLSQAFARACDELAYSGDYLPVYPIKVNQQFSVVNELYGSEHPLGLEAGSKPELLAILGLAKPGGTLVCNGYKDREYIRTALIGQSMGYRVFIVVEKLSELALILEQADALGVKPDIGVRLRLASIGKGKWQNSGGEKAKFGLSACQLIQLLDQLRDAGRLDCLRLLHFHMGSQVANIHDLQTGIQEAARYYVQLRQQQVPVEVMDVGGGLAIDYDGTGSRNEYSMNYSLGDYAHTIVKIIQSSCDAQELPHPTIFSESGRALTAHHAVLVTSVIETESQPGGPLPEHPGDVECLQALAAIQPEEGGRNVEAYYDARYWYRQALDLYALGVLDLPHRAQAEILFMQVCRRLQACLQAASRSQREILDELNEMLADKYFCNLSVFQSLPDVWGIDQVFPVVPIHRLEQRPDKRGIVFDLTCDSDGHIEFYADNQGIEKTLPLHGLQEGEDYCLGFFLVGAYQEILGDMHNLFGDTDAINVRLDGQGGYVLENPELGDPVDELLAYVHFKVDKLVEHYRERLSASGMATDRQESLLQELEEGLKGYTYFEK